MIAFHKSLRAASVGWAVAQQGVPVLFNPCSVMKTQSLARRTVPAFFVTLRTPCTHSMHTSQVFLLHSSFAVLTRKLCHRHVADHIHMHFHDNPTDTQNNCAHTYEAGLGSTTPQRNPSDTARSTFGHQAELLPSTSYVSGVAVEFWASLRPWCGYFQHIELSSGSRAAPWPQSCPGARCGSRPLCVWVSRFRQALFGWLLSARSSS